jgi:hypothetical protein
MSDNQRVSGVPGVPRGKMEHLKRLIINIFHNVPGVPHIKMECFCQRGGRCLRLTHVKQMNFRADSFTGQHGNHGLF